MKSDFFPQAKSESPRRLWLREHDVHTHLAGDPADFDGEPWSAWSGDLMKAINADEVYGGVDPDAAICRLAIARGWRLWNEQGISVNNNNQKKETV